MFESVITVLLFVPFFLILHLANLADKRRLESSTKSSLAVVTYLLHIFVFGIITAIGAALQGLGLFFRLDPNMKLDLLDSLGNDGAAPVAGMIALLDRMEFLGIALWAPAMVAPLLLLPPVRRLIARGLPIDPRSSVHAVALSFVMLIVINLTLTLGVGLDTLANLMDDTPTEIAPLLLSLWVQQLTFALWALIGIGWLTRRAWLPALARLGIVVPRPVEVAIAIGAGLVAVGVIILLESVAASVGFGVDEDVERLSEALFGPLVRSIPGILTLGLAAGIGEETLFRGALQPRFGLLFTSILFALVHSQYGITFSTLAVFIVGLILGLLRLRFNTSTCVITHATYNITLGLIAFLFPQLF